MSKPARQQAILDLVQQQPIASQDDLRRLLARHGHHVTQATLSRDIHDLRLVKTPLGYSLPAQEDRSEPAQPSVSRLAHEFVVAVHEAQNLLVVKTSVGAAQPVAASLDAAGWKEMLGSIAGDDTILIVTADKRQAHRLAERIRGMIVE
jgi:transcriptional regulator of arginine metabolism